MQSGGLSDLGCHLGSRWGKKLMWLSAGFHSPRTFRSLLAIAWRWLSASCHSDLSHKVTSLSKPAAGGLLVGWQWPQKWCLLCIALVSWLEASYSEEGDYRRPWIPGGRDLWDHLWEAASHSELTCGCCPHFGAVENNSHFPKDLCCA